MLKRLAIIIPSVVIFMGISAITIADDALFQYHDLQGTFYCRFDSEGRWESGVMNGSNSFRSFNSEINRLKLIFRRNRSRQIQKQIKALQIRSKSTSIICAEGLLATPIPGPISTTSPTQIPIPPTPPSIGVTNTPAPTISFFDVNGEMTTEGKQFLAIPVALSANIEQGLTLFSQYQCIKCHSERLNRTFETYRENLKRAPMNFNEISLPDSDLANLTAYLNRFR